MYHRFGKRFIDLIFILITAPVSLSVVLITSIYTAIHFGCNPFFGQLRGGQHGRPFTLYKFRTMTNQRDESGQLLPDHQRLTSYGYWLRQTSLDELPQLWNILRGDMSLIGPRPLLVDYLSLYTAEQQKRHSVRPGLTGLAQINGRNTISWPQKFVLDNLYIQHLSLSLDLRIIWRTIWVVLKGQKEVSFMPRFTGQSL